MCSEPVPGTVLGTNGEKTSVSPPDPTVTLPAVVEKTDKRHEITVE